MLIVYVLTTRLVDIVHFLVMMFGIKVYNYSSMSNSVPDIKKLPEIKNKKLVTKLHLLVKKFQFYLSDL